jgi:hypothetical protein
LHDPWWMRVLLGLNVVSGAGAFVLAPLALVTARLDCVLPGYARSLLHGAWWLWLVPISVGFPAILATTAYYQRKFRSAPEPELQAV